MCAFVWGQLQPIGQGNITIMNIQTQPLEGTAARDESHAVTVVQGHFLDLLEQPTLQNMRKRGKERDKDSKREEKRERESTYYLL